MKKIEKKEKKVNKVKKLIRNFNIFFKFKENIKL